MSWLTILLAVAALVALVATVGIQPKGARPVAGTRLMSVARIILIAVLMAAVYIAFRGR
jgi:hypothetical protein